MNAKRSLLTRAAPATLLAGLWLGAAAAEPVPIGSARPVAGAAPVAVLCPPAVPASTLCHAARDERGAYVLSARPAPWNGVLIVHIHGGPRIGPVRVDSSFEDLERFAEFVREGYAWVASSRRSGGYGVRDGVEDADAARRLWLSAFGPARQTIVHGQSWGGNVGAKLIEIANAPDAQGRRPYDGALLTAGVLAGGVRGYDMRIDLRAAMQAICGNHPRPDEPAYPVNMGLPPGPRMARADLAERLKSCAGVGTPAAERTPEQARNLADLVAASRIPESALLGHLVWATNLFQDISQRLLGGRSPFGNIGVRYVGTSDDAAFNARVPRLAADPGAVAALAHDADLTGRFEIPVLTLHAIRDLTAVVAHQSVYRETVAKAGNSERLVQVFVDEAEHSKMSPPLYPGALAALQTWIATGRKPAVADVAAACETARARHLGACRIDAGYAPPAWSAMVNPRPATAP